MGGIGGADFVLAVRHVVVIYLPRLTRRHTEIRPHARLHKLVATAILGQTLHLPAKAENLEALVPSSLNIPGSPRVPTPDHPMFSWLSLQKEANSSEKLEARIHRAGK